MPEAMVYLLVRDNREGEVETVAIFSDPNEAEDWAEACNRGENTDEDGIFDDQLGWAHYEVDALVLDDQRMLLDLAEHHLAERVIPWHAATDDA